MTKSARGTIENPGYGRQRKTKLNSSILEQTWGLLLNQIRYKAEWAGREFVEVDPKFTSRICSECKISMTPQDEYRTYCGVCGFVSDRDLNASINILNRAFGRGNSAQHENAEIQLTSVGM